MLLNKCALISAKSCECSPISFDLNISSNNASSTFHIRVWIVLCSGTIDGNLYIDRIQAHCSHSIRYQLKRCCFFISFICIFHRMGDSWSQSLAISCEWCSLARSVRLLCELFVFICKHFPSMFVAFWKWFTFYSRKICFVVQVVVDYFI